MFNVRYQIKKGGKWIDASHPVASVSLQPSSFEHGKPTLVGWNKDTQVQFRFTLDHACKVEITGE